MMINNNMKTSYGLYNGKIGTVKSIIYEENTYPPDLPKAVILEVEGDEEIPRNLCYKGLPNHIIIEPMQKYKLGTNTYRK